MRHSSCCSPHRRDPVQTYRITISQGREKVHGIRGELFAFTEVLDVFVTGRPDLLVIVCAGRPRLGEWVRALRAVGYEVAPRQHSSASTTTGRSIIRIHAPVSEIDPARRPHAA
jgi:hypothetical protein